LLSQMEGRQKMKEVSYQDYLSDKHGVNGLQVYQPIFRSTASGRTVWLFPEVCLVTNIPNEAKTALPSLCSRKPGQRHHAIKDFARLLSNSKVLQQYGISLAPELVPSPEHKSCTPHVGSA
jgi:hypothetical protein